MATSFPVRARSLAQAALGAVLLTALAAGRAPPADAGCLAPTDAEIDSAGAVGPFWGNDAGTLLYTRDPLGNLAQLMVRDLGAFPEVVAEEAKANDFYVGLQRERWVSFHTGTVNANGDLAFVASTKLPTDDTATPQNEVLARRGVYARRSNTMFEVARFGGESPILAFPSGKVPWSSFFEAVALGRVTPDPLHVVFTAQLGAPDGRTGIFEWDEITQTATPIVLTGDASPSGGTFLAFGRVRGNEAGDLAVFAATQVGSAEETAAGGLFLFTRDGGRSRIVRSGADGDMAPGGGRVRGFSDFDLASDGTVVFASTLEGAGPASALFRATAPTYQLERIFSEGAPTPIGGTFGSLASSTVRLTETGEIALAAPVSADVGGTGLFTIPAGSSDASPLGTAKSIVLAATLGPGRMAYQSEDETHVVAGADGTEEGPKDFRVAALDLRNGARLKSDTLKFDARFLLPSWGDKPPATFRADLPRFSTTQSLTGAAVSRIAEVRLELADNSGQQFVFGMTGPDADPTPSVIVNTRVQDAKKLTLAKDGSSATWAFSGAFGSGSFKCDLAAGTCALRVSNANLLPPFDALHFKVELTLRTASDVSAGRTGAAAYFFQGIFLDGEQPNFPGGRRVVSKGETLDGGTFYVDALRVDRKLKVIKGQAAPDVDSDRVTLTGTLRLCPGATPPATPTLLADFSVGDLVLDDVVMKRVSGAHYAYASPKGASPSVRFDVDAVKGTFSLRASGLGPLAALGDADFAAAPESPNADDHDVGGFVLPVSFHVDRVYEAQLDVPMTRLRGGRVFVR